MRKRIRDNKILVYAFFQILIVAAARNIVAPLIPIISGELDVGLDFIGSAIALSIFGLFFVSLTTGNLIEVIGLKKVLFIGLGINFTGSLLLYFSHTFSIFIIAYFLMELGLGMLIIGNLSIVGTLYPKNKVSSLIKINIGHTTALIFSPLIVSLTLFIRVDWRYYYIFNLVPLIALAIVLWRIKIPKITRVETSLRNLFSANKRIITNPAFIMCGLIIFFYTSIMNTFFVWFTSYFKNINIDINISSLFLSIFGVAIFIGMLLRNKLIKHFKKKGILLFSFIISFFLLIGILFTGNLIAKIVLIFFFGISIAGNFTITFSIGSGLFPKYTNSASGLSVAFANLGIMTFQYLSGYMSEYYSKNSVLYINISILFILIILTSFLNFHRKFSRT
ncbi:MAG: MFS transporter [Actinobacteria bacterium]|nr:MFS transporter [Actinomycetota bacterium]MBU4482856.1 MFS transporter [Actinomycetota bacterium]